MVKTLELQTGDVTSHPTVLKAFSITVSEPTDAIEFNFDNAEASVEYTDWPALIAQIRERSLSKWKFTTMDDPIGDPDFQRLLAQVHNTPTYQLFLAGFDIAQIIGLVSDLDDRVIYSRCLSLERRCPSTIGLHGLFFVSDSILANIHSNVINELLENNKLGRVLATIADFGEVAKYYIPYATPDGFPLGSCSEDAIQLWEQVRQYYYAFR